MTFRILILAALVASATGCTTIKGWFSDDKDAATEPAPLVDIPTPIATGEVWSRNLGDGREKQGLLILGDHLLRLNATDTVLQAGAQIRLLPAGAFFPLCGFRIRRTNQDGQKC